MQTQRCHFISQWPLPFVNASFFTHHIYENALIRSNFLRISREFHFEFFSTVLLLLLLLALALALALVMLLFLLLLLSYCDGKINLSPFKDHRKKRKTQNKRHGIRSIFCLDYDLGSPFFQCA